MTTRARPARRPRAAHQSRAEALWRAWGRPAFAVAIVVVLLFGLGIANIVVRARWHEVEDGVLWGARPRGVTAVEVAPGSAGARAGIQARRRAAGRQRRAGANAGRGHRVPAPRQARARGSPIRSCAWAPRQALEVSLAAAGRPASMYFVLAAVGPLHAAGRRVGPAPAPARSGDAAFLLALRRVLRRLHVLVQRAVRSSRLDVLLG